MEKTIDKDTLKNNYTTAGVVCFPVAVFCLSFGVIFAIEFFDYVINARALPKDSILYFIGGTIRFFMYVLFPVCFIALTVCTVKFITGGIALIKQSYIPKTKRALRFSFISSLTICLISAYPFIINTLRIIVHGYLQEYYYGFWLGMTAFVTSTLCLIFNRIAARNTKLFHKTYPH